MNPKAFKRLVATRGNPVSRSRENRFMSLQAIKDSVHLADVIRSQAKRLGEKVKITFYRCRCGNTNCGCWPSVQRD